MINVLMEEAIPLDRITRVEAEERYQKHRYPATRCRS